MIVADDTPNEEFIKIDSSLYPFASHYKMPEYTGWFAGRALAISQVTTDFFVWVDDDFKFTAETDIQYLLDVIIKTGL